MMLVYYILFPLAIIVGLYWVLNMVTFVTLGEWWFPGVNM